MLSTRMKVLVTTIFGSIREKWLAINVAVV